MALAQDGFRVGKAMALRLDGVGVVLDPGLPPKTLGHPVQEALCLMERNGEDHVLIGSILCFQASWWLTEKLGKPLLAIHTPAAGTS